MKIFLDTKRLVEKEKYYTGKILQNLLVIERDKLYCDLKYPSLHKYLVRELGYSDKEAAIRVHAVRLMRKSKRAEKKIVKGDINLSKAAQVGKALLGQSVGEKQVEEFVDKAETCSARALEGILDEALEKERREVLVLPEYLLKKFDRMREKYGDLSTLELIKMMLEREMKEPPQIKDAKRRPRDAGMRKRGKRSRHIPAMVKREVYNGQCANCGVRHDLEYDHILKYSHGGSHSADNIQMLCRPCNQRKEMVARQMGFFT